MGLSVTANAEELWKSWNIEGFIILSLSAQAFLILLAPLRKRIRGIWGKCIDILLWLAYLLADWVASITIGFIIRKQIKRSDLQVFWAPFLLLHLGGPDTITSFALEDNEFWVRHLLGLALQFGSTLYVFIMSLPENKLWLPTLLVLIAGIIKYAEPNRAFYLASFDHFGDNWVSSVWEDGIHIPEQFQKMDRQATFDDGSRSIVWSAVHHFGSIKRILVGPFLSLNQCSDIRDTFLQEKADNALRIMEIELSLLYEVLHTKLPVVDCKTGYVFRVINLVCLLGALLSFSLLKKHYELLLFDILLTYGLLMGSLALDLISIILQFFCSDWIFVAHLQNRESTFINRKRWSDVVSQLNFITYHIKDCPSWLKNVAEFLYMKSWLEGIRGLRCLSSQKFREWHFIFEEVKQLNEYLSRKLKDSSKTVLEAKEVGLYSRKRVLKDFRSSEQLTQITKDLDYTEGILTWHIATELCFRGEDQRPASRNGITNDYKAICKKFSDYMFYLAVMQPTMMAAVSVNWKMVFEDTLVQTKSYVSSVFSNEQDASRKILEQDTYNMKRRQKILEAKKSVLGAAIEPARQLKQLDRTYPWESMSKVWVQLMCTAAINCRPIVHAQQPSKGGELLTFIWLVDESFGTRNSLFNPLLRLMAS